MAMGQRAERKSTWLSVVVDYLRATADTVKTLISKAGWSPNETVKSSLRVMPGQFRPLWGSEDLEVWKIETVRTQLRWTKIWSAVW